MPSRATALCFDVAEPADTEAVVALVQSAYRGEAGRAGWTSEAELLDGIRTDAAAVAAVITDPRSVLLLARRPDDRRQAPPHLPSRGPAGAPGASADRGPHGPAGAASGKGRSGLIVACCHLRDDGHRAYFGMFAVRPGEQGGGIGRAVVVEAQRRVAARWGCSEMWMTVIAQRADLISWYERLGFRRTGETEPFPYGDERFGIPKRPDLVFAVLSKVLDPTG